MDASLFLLSSSGITTPNDPDSCSFAANDHKKGQVARQGANCLVAQN
jgi:uncharacterized caspase-like protein